MEQEQEPVEVQMEYEERNGILCWRGQPEWPWVAFTQQQLTKKLLDAWKEIEQLEEEINLNND